MNRFTTAHPDTGQTAKRGSQNRTYTHAVWTQTPAAAIQARLERDLAYYRAKADEYRAKAAAGGEDMVSTTGKVFGRHTSEDFTEWADALDVRIADTEAKLAAGVTDGPWGCHGWCGRPDLADKKAAGLRKQGYRVAITEAVAA